MKRLVDMLMAGVGIGLMLLASAIKAGKFGGEQFDLTSGETTIMLVVGIMLFIMATLSLKNSRR